MLNLISTPIGNLNDISLRAIDVLKNADYIFAEDTRKTNKLLQFIDVKNKSKAFHEHNEDKATSYVISLLKKDDINIVLVSDAGTPTISDPGYFLVQECIKTILNFH